MHWFFSKTKYLFFLLIILKLNFYLYAFSPEKKTELSKVVNQFTRKRDGVVLLGEEKENQISVFGNEKLIHKKFLPGSLFKLLTAEAALDQKDRWFYHCDGFQKIGKKIVRCWSYRGHGNLDLSNALAQSCNLFFSTLGIKIGPEKILEKMKKYHFKAVETVQLDLLRNPVLLARFAIGDDPSIKTTPLEMFHFWKEFLQTIQDSRYFSIVQGLQKSVEFGTARYVFSDSFSILAKTGTADSLSSKFPTYGWLVFASSDSPVFFGVILLEESHGFSEPVQLAKKILKVIHEK